MIKKISVLLSLIFIGGIFAAAQTAQLQNSTASELLMRLPDSEAVMQIDAKRLFDDALPLLTNSNQVQLAEINRRIADFKNQTGIGARDFAFFAVSLDFSPKITSLFPPQGTLTPDPVILARSTTNNAAQILAAALSASQSSLPFETRERKYKGREILTIRITDATRVFGIFDLKNKEVSIAALNEKTIAVGNPDAVRGAITAYDGGGKRVDQKIAQSAVRNSNAVMGCAGIVLKYVPSRIKFGTPELSRPFKELRGFYGALDAAQDRFVLTTNLQTTGTQAAADLSQTINLLKDFIPGLVDQLPQIPGKAAGVAANRAENATVKTNGAEVEIRIEIAPKGELRTVEN